MISLIGRKGNRFNSKEKNTFANTVYTSCGFQSNLQVQSSLAKAVTVDSEVATNSRTLHTLNVCVPFKKMRVLCRFLIYTIDKIMTLQLIEDKS